MKAVHSDSGSDFDKGSISPPPSPARQLQRKTSFTLPSGRLIQFAEDLISAEGALPVELLGKWETERKADSTARVAQTLLSGVSMSRVLMGREAERETPMVFNHRVDMSDLPVADQTESGRCWIFAICNVLRVFLQRRYMIADFQLSQSYLHFWDIYSKAEYFLHQMVDLIEEPLDSRLMHKLMKDSVEDGGTHDLACLLVQRFGVVPRSVYGESFNSRYSDELRSFLTSKLREHALELRAEYGRLRAKGHSKAEAAKRTKAHILFMMRQVYRCLAIALGTPPTPHTSFKWSFAMTEGSVVTLTRTPLSLYEGDLKPAYDLAQSITFSHDPRPSSKNRAVYGVEHERGMIGGRASRMLNVEIEEMKQIAIYMVQAQVPVWFACDVEKSFSHAGILDLRLYDYSDAFGAQLNLTKAHRLQLKDGEPTHAMVLTGVHLDEHSSRPVRWQVANSWGETDGKKGFWCMTDEWFSEHVYQIGAPRSFVPAHHLSAFDEGETHMLPIWDPFG